MGLPLIRLVVPVSAALCAMLAFVSPALAEGETCLRDTDCGGSEVCLGGLCAAPETAPPTCEAGCEFDETCDDGFCKVEGITCDNPAGRCWVEQDHGLCECLSGEGAGWSDGFNPDDPPDTKTDEELVVQCGEALVDACGTEAPSLPDTCAGDVLTDCEAFIALENAAIGDCGDGTPEVTIARVGDCCDTYAEPFYVDYRECVMAADAPTCSLIGDCEGGNTGEADTDGDSDPTQGATTATMGDTDPSGGAEDQDQDTSSCSVGNRGQGWALLGLFALLPFVRRRR